MPRLPAWSNRPTSEGVVAVPFADTPNTNAPPLFAEAFGFMPHTAATRSLPPKVLLARKSILAILLADDAELLLTVKAVVEVPKAPVTSNLLAGEAVPMPTSPADVILSDSVPPSVKAIVSAAGNQIPVLVSPVVVIDGAAAEPAAKVAMLEAVSVVKVPAAADEPPIVVPSIVPPLMSVVVKTDEARVTTPVESAIEPAAVPSLALRLVTSMLVVSTVVALTVVMLPVVAVAVVNVPAAAELAPIVVPSIVPPLMSVVVKTEDPSVTTPVESAIDPAAVPSLALMLVTSTFVVSTVVALTVVMLPVVAPSVVNVPAAAVAPPITVLSTVPPLMSTKSSMKMTFVPST